MGYIKDAIKGITWISLLRAVTRVFAFGKTVIIARVLSPSQFGIFGVIALLLALFDVLTETGVDVFLIQTKDSLHRYNNTAWILSIAKGSFTSVLLFTLTPFIARFFHTPDATNILLLASATPLIQGLINPASIEFQKELKFKQEFLYRSTLFFIDAFISTIAVLMLHSVYGLVYGLIAGAVSEVIFSFILFQPKPTFMFSFADIKMILHKGKWVTVFGITNYFSQQGDNIVVGRVLGTGALGLYEMAYSISTIPISEIADVAGVVTFPIYSKIAEDKKRLQRAFLKVMLLILPATIFATLILFFFPKQIIYIILGKNWMTAAEILPFLAIFAGIRTIFGSSSSLFMATGNQKYTAVMTLARSVVLIATIIPFLFTFGLVGAAYSAIASATIEIPFVLYYLFKIFCRKSHEVS